MSSVRRLVLVAGVVCGASCGEAPQVVREFDFDRSLGLGSATLEGPCILFPDSLSPGLELTALWVPTDGVDEPAMAARIAVDERLPARCDIPEGGDSNSQSFSVSPSPDYLDFGRLYIVFPTPRGGVALDGRGATADLDGMPPEETFRSCTGSESVHVSVWSGPALTGTQRWRGWRYLQYDVIPTCTEDDFQVDGDLLK